MTERNFEQLAIWFIETVREHGDWYSFVAKVFDTHQWKELTRQCRSILRSHNRLIDRYEGALNNTDGAGLLEEEALGRLAKRYLNPHQQTLDARVSGEKDTLVRTVAEFKLRLISKAKEVLRVAESTCRPNIYVAKKIWKHHCNPPTFYHRPENGVSLADGKEPSPPPESYWSDRMPPWPSSVDQALQRINRRTDSYGDVPNPTEKDGHISDDAKAKLAEFTLRVFRAAPLQCWWSLRSMETVWKQALTVRKRRQKSVRLVCEAEDTSKDVAHADGRDSEDGSQPHSVDGQEAARSSQTDSTSEEVRLLWDAIQALLQEASGTELQRLKRNIAALMRFVLREELGIVGHDKFLGWTSQTLSRSVLFHEISRQLANAINPRKYEGDEGLKEFLHDFEGSLKPLTELLWENRESLSLEKQAGTDKDK